MARLIVCVSSVSHQYNSRSHDHESTKQMGVHLIYNITITSCILPQKFPTDPEQSARNNNNETSMSV
ncbi:hypothetical protein DID88_010309 [Monilinia fructigena]|uniref:Uncharacterized protein n=1 Tax=Monilinia fructigena TaxID=38457 RepID=A0A395ILS7_9HELO|nr:hypothetical protein DID88_010309 [Monilinia fructigena]